MLGWSRLGFALLLLTGAACSDVRSGEDETRSDMPAPVALYDQLDGDTYMYVGELSTEDQKEGEHAPVLNFKFLGAEGATHRLELVDDYGSRLALLECSHPCRVMKQTSSDGSFSRVALGAGSIIEAAFTDAFNGHLIASADGWRQTDTLTRVPLPNEPPPAATETETTGTANSTAPVRPILSGEWANYKTRILGGWDTEPTLAGRFVIIRWGCGTGCTFNIVGDRRTGRIYDLGLGGEEMQMLELKFSDASNSIKAAWEDSESDSCIRENFIWAGTKLISSGRRLLTPRGDGCSVAT